MDKNKFKKKKKKEQRNRACDNTFTDEYKEYDYGMRTGNINPAIWILGTECSKTHVKLTWPQYDQRSLFNAISTTNIGKERNMNFSNA